MHMGDPREHHDRPDSFYASPEEATRTAPEKLLYLACLHVGTGVERPDFIAVVDADPESDDYGEIVHETPMPNVGDELHHFGWNRCSSACHGPDRSHLIVPGFRSSRIHVLNVADDPRRPRIEKVIEPAEVAETTGYTRPHTVHCMPGDNIVVSMLGDREGGRGRVRGPRRTQLRGQGALGKRRRDARAQLRLLVPAAQERVGLIGVRRAQRLRARFRDRRRGRGPVRPSAALLGSGGATPWCRPWTSARRAASHWRCAGFTTPTQTQGFVGATLASNVLRFHRTNGAFTAEPVIEVENEELESWPLPGGVPGLITDVVRLDGRPLPLLLELAARRPPPVRHLRSRAPEADGPALARWAAWEVRATLAGTWAAGRK